MTTRTSEARVVELTEAQWGEVFRLRCQAKRGGSLSVLERRLVERAYREDPDRYARLTPDVFDATVPFGSTARWRR